MKFTPIFESKFRTRVSRGIAAALSAWLAAAPCLADKAETSLWAERRNASARDRDGASTMLASAAGARPDAGRLFQGLPRPQSTGLAPSIANQISRFSAPGSRKRLADIVRALPAQSGTVRDVVAGKNGDRVVIHIHDVHLNREAQENIASAVRGLAAGGLADVVALEGAFGPIDLSPFRKFPDQAIVRKVASFLASEHRISGPVGALMSADSPAAVVGVDARDRYEANVAAYRRAEPLRGGHKQRVAARERELAELKRAAYAPELARFDASVASYDRGQLPLGAYIRILARHADELPMSVQTFLAAHEIESGLDFARVEAERSRLLAALVARLAAGDIDRLVADSLDYRLGRVGHGAFYASLRAMAERHGVALSSYPAMDAYIRYVLLTDGIRAHDLYRDIDVLRARAFAGLARSDRERALVSESERIGLAARLLDFALTPEEWDRYAREPKESLSFIGDLSAFESFYREADARNDALVANLLRTMDAGKSRIGVLVTGGFHGPGVAARLARAGLSTVTYVPRLTKVDVDGSAYLSVFTQEKTPLDRLFEGPRLFLAQNPAPVASLNMAAVLDSAEAVRVQAVPVDQLRAWFRDATGFDLQAVEAAEGGFLRVTYAAPGASSPTSVLVRALDNGRFEMAPADRGSGAAVVGGLLATLVGWWSAVRRSLLGDRERFERPDDSLREQIGDLSFEIPAETEPSTITASFVADAVRGRLAERGLTVVGEPVRLGGGYAGEAFRLLLVRNGRAWSPGQAVDTSVVVKIAGGDLGFEMSTQLGSLDNDALTLDQNLPRMPKGRGVVRYGGAVAAVFMDFSRELAEGTPIDRAVSLWNSGARRPVPRRNADGSPVLSGEGRPLFDHPISPASLRAQIRSLIAGNDVVAYWDPNAFANFAVYDGLVYQVDPGAFSPAEQRTADRGVDDYVTAIMETSIRGWMPPLWSRVAFNTTFVLVPALTAATVAVLAAFGVTVTAPLVIATYLIYKAALFVSVLAHEMGHLWADGQLDGVPIREPVLRALGRPTPGNVIRAIEAIGALAALGARTLNREYLLASFIAGSDIVYAYVTPSRRADEDEDVARARIARTAIAGPLANVALMGAGAAVVAAGFAAAFLNADAGFALRLAGGALVATNASLLAINAVYGVDLRAWLTGRLPGGVFRMLGGAFNVFAGRVGSRSLASRRHPDRNEDAEFSEELPGGILIAGVFDGIGGHQGGERASRMARDVVRRRLQSISTAMTERQVIDLMANAMIEANDEIGRAMAGTRAGSAASVMVLLPTGENGQRRALIINSADTRAYLQNAGRLQPLTVDNVEPAEGEDILVMDLDDVNHRLDQGYQRKIGAVESASDMSVMTNAVFGFRNIVSNNLGDGHVYRPVVTAVSVPAGGRVLLTSDGVHDNLSDNEILAAMQGSPQQAADALIQEARARSEEAGNIRSKADDMTALVIEIPAADGAVEQPGRPLRDGDVSLGPGDVATNISFREGTTVVTIDMASIRTAITVRRDADGLVAEVGGREIRLYAGENFYFGRSGDNDAVIPAGNVSRFHLVLNVDDDGRLTVRDLFARNGTRVHVRQADGEWRLIAAEADMARAEESESNTIMGTFYSAEDRASLKSRAVNDYSEMSIADFVRRRPGANRGQQPDEISIGELTRRIQNLPLLQPRATASEEERKTLAFLKEFLNVLLDKHNSGSYSADWQVRARVLMKDFLDRAEKIAGGEVFGSPVPTPETIRASSAFRRNVDAIASTADGDTIWIATRDGNPMRIAVRRDAQGNLLTLGIERKVGDQDYRPRVINGRGDTRIAGLLNRFKLSLAGADFVELDYNAEFRTLTIIVRKDGSERAYLVSLDYSESARDDSPLRLNPVRDDLVSRLSRQRARESAAAPSAPAEARPAPSVSEIVRANLAFFSDRLFEGTVAQARLFSSSRSQSSTVEALVDANGQILTVGDRRRFPAETNDRVANGEQFVVSIRVRGLLAEGDYLVLGSEALPPAARAALERSIEAENNRRAEIDAANEASRQEALERLRALPGEDAAIVAGNVAKIFGSGFRNVRNDESIGGNAGAGHAAVNGVADARGNIVMFGNIQDYPEDIRRSIHAGDLFEFGIRVKMFPVDGPDYELYADGAPDEVEAILSASVDAANEQKRLENESSQGTGILDSVAAGVGVRYDRYEYRSATLQSSTEHALPASIQVVNTELRLDRGERGAVMLSLVDAGGDSVAGLARPIRITRQPVMIGRNVNAAVRIVERAVTEAGEKPRVSGTHIEIFLDERGQIVIRDASLNGTVVRTQPALTTADTLANGLRVLRRLGVTRLLDAAGLSRLAPNVVRLTYALVAEFHRFYVGRADFVEQHVSDGTFAATERAYVRRIVNAVTYASYVGALVMPVAAALIGADTGWLGFSALALAGLLAGNVGAHAVINLALILSGSRAAGPAAWSRAGDAERVGEALIAAAVALSANKAGLDVDSLLGGVVELNIGRAFVPGHFQRSVAPRSVDPSAVVAHVRANLAGRLRAGDLTFVEAQRVAEKLSTWLGESVRVGDRSVVSVARRTDAGKIADLLRERPSQTAVTVIVNTADRAFFEENFADAIRSGRLAVRASGDPLFDGAARVNAAALEAALVANFDRAALGNVLLTMSNELSFEGADLAPGSVLAGIRYKALEDLLNNLPEINVLPLGVIIDAAKVLAVQA